MLLMNDVELGGIQRMASGREVETCAIGFVSRISNDQGDLRFVVSSLAEVPLHAYLARTNISATLAADFCLNLFNEARSRGAGIILMHTHIGGDAPLNFSSVDDNGEVALAAYFARLGACNFSAVVTTDGVIARMLGTTDLVPVVVLGGKRRSTKQIEAGMLAVHDRQIRAFGTAGQGVLQELKIAIVGLGGTGSVVTQQLAHLGVRKFILIDPDNVEETNLNRLIGASAASVGAQKTQVAAEMIKRISPDAECEVINGDVVDDFVSRQILMADFIFSCTDSLASRAVLNQIAYQYLIPCIDMGVAIGTADGQVSYISGRVQLLSPSLGCLACGDLLDAEKIRIEMMSEEARRRDQYIVGASEPQPSVISINSTVSSLAVSMFLSVVTEIPGESRLQNVDGIRGTVRPAVATINGDCLVCSGKGALGRGDGWELPVRRKGRA